MSAAPTKERTFLRVKRRRHENPPSTIRLELLGGWNVRKQDENDGNFSNGNHGPLRSSSTTTLGASSMSSCSTQTVTTSNVNPTTSSRPRTTTAAAVWKRVEDLEGEGQHPKRGRVVEAIFESDGPSTKRRKLTVLGEAKEESSVAATKKKPNNFYKVLDPISRLVDDSLTMVHSGEKSIADHYRFVTTDPRLATNSRQWLVYQNRGGNLLHACAQWNDVECTHDLLRQSLTGLVDATDDDGRTPYETAQMCSHDSVVEVLEAFGADTTNFVYDIFVPEEIQVEETTTTQPKEEEWNPLEKTAIGSNDGAAASEPPPPDMTMVDASRLLELQGGVGYWTEEGDLVLEVEAHHMMGITNEFGYESEEDCGEEIDSNCEDYGGNDYPDEASWEEAFLQEEPTLEEDPFYDRPTADEYDMF